MPQLVKDVYALIDIVKHIIVKDIMKTPAITVTEGEDFSSVEEIFVENGIRHLPVVDQQKRLVGFISQKDVYTHIAPRRLPEGKIEYRPGIIIDGDGYYEKESLNKYILDYVMHRNPVTINENGTLLEVIHLLIEKRIDCLSVIDQDRHVVGVVSRGDLLRLIDAADQKVKKAGSPAS